MSSAESKINRKLREENDKSMTIVFGSAMIALHRYWGWGKKRIQDLQREIMVEWILDQGRGENYSMMKMLEDETGIDMQLNGKSWHDVDFLNGVTKTTDRVKRMGETEYLYMMHQKIRWQPIQFTASVLLALYRKHGFSSERDVRLMDQMSEIQREFKFKPQKIIAAMKQETGVDLWEPEKKKQEAEA